MLQPTELRGKSVLILGLGAFGGGVGCARHLARLGARVTATDLRSAAELPEAVKALSGLPVRLTLGGHEERLFEAADVVVVNPAVPESSPWLEVARRCGCRLTTEVNLAVAAATHVPALAVTGTHGKSTTAALAAHLLGAACESGGRTVLAGNLGGSLLEGVEGLGARDRLVTELSSFQTERLESARPWPAVALLTCLGRDHLDRHGGEEGYAAAKRRLLAFQDPSSTALLPFGDPESARWAAAAPGRVLWFSGKALPPEKEGWGMEKGALFERTRDSSRVLASQDAFPIREPFRVPGLVAAVAGARLLGLPDEAVERGLRGFQGLPHRMEALPAPAGRTYLDNAVATHPDPTLAALRSLPGPLILVAGGKDKGLPLDELAAQMRSCRVAHLFGEGGERLATLCTGGNPSLKVHSDARSAILGALAGMQDGETLLFSPSFSSYDQFRNFRDRAAVFRDLCRESLLGTERDPRDKERAAY